MDTPRIDFILNQLGQPKRAERWEAALKALEEGVGNRRIWNSDYEDAKFQLGRAWDAVEDKACDPLRDLYYRGKDAFRAWRDNDPRHDLGSHALLNVPGYVARLKRVKDAPELAGYIAVLEEAARIGLLLKEVRPFVVKGRKPNPNPTPVDLANTGTCPICQCAFKMHPGPVMVDHGFQISDGAGHYFGFRSGKCFGVRKKPYELSCESNREFIVILNEALVKAKERIDDLSNGKVTAIGYTVRKRVGPGRYEDEQKTAHPGEPSWERAFKHEVIQAESRVAGLENQIEVQTKLVETWVLKPLPGSQRP